MPRARKKSPLPILVRLEPGGRLTLLSGSSAEEHERLKRALDRWAQARVAALLAGEVEKAERP